MAKVRERMGNEKPNDWVADKLGKREDQRDDGPLQPVVDLVPQNIFLALSEMKMIQIIFFAIFFGIALALIPEEKGKALKAVIEGLNEVFIKIIWIVMGAMPIFVFALMAGQIVVAAGKADTI